MLAFKCQIMAAIFLTGLTTMASAQKSSFEVLRCSAVNRNNDVPNITISSDGTKLVANGPNVYQVKSCDRGSTQPLQTGEQSVLSFFGGNTDFRWMSDVLRMEAKNATDITSAWYDEANDWLWLGTKTNGVFQFKTKPTLVLIEQITTEGTKLPNNEITLIYKDPSGKYWIGTKEGFMTGAPKKWKTELSGYRSQRVRAIGNNLFVLSDGELWRVENGEKWKAVTIDEKAIEGEPADFDFDPDGNLWLLSHMLSRYDLNTDEFEIFSGPEYYTSEYGTCLAADANGIVWVGTDDKGLFQVSKRSTFLADCTIDPELSCGGNSKDAGIVVKTTGGKEPFTYQWSASYLQGDMPKGVAAGPYTVTVTDATGKTAVAKVTVNDPKLTLTTKVRTAESAPGKADGSAEVSVTGGTTPYTYAWSNNETGNPARQLAEGAYTVTVTDQKGCSATATLTMTQKVNALAVTLQETGAIKCNGGTSTIKATINGGKAPFNLAWSEAGMSGEQPGPVTAGIYQVTVTDARQTTATASINIKEPNALSASAQASNAATTGTADGRAGVQPQGGTGRYTILWDNGETTGNATRLAAGAHTVTVTDSNGCTATATVDVSENILPLNAQIIVDGAIKCNGGTVNLAVRVAGGKTPYTYTWNEAALSGAQLTGVAAGNYTVTISDASGKTATVTTNVRQPQPIALNATVKSQPNAGKTDGKASVQALGGAGKFTFAWSNGETGATPSQLAPGTHTVTVTDANGCTATASIDVSETILPLTLKLETSGQIKCGSEKVTLNAVVSGGKAPIEFHWSNPAWQSVGTIADASAGTYAVTITDAKGTTQTASVTVNGPQPLVATVIRSVGATTERSKDGHGTLDIKGGSKPYKIAWDNKETLETASQLTFGPHSVTVTDGNGCTTTASTDIGKRILPELTAASLQNGQAVRVEQLQFQADSTRLTPECYPVLDEIYAFLMENGGIVIEVGGHTNSVPSDAFCDRLSTARAKSVADYLIAKGIDPKRVLYKGYGKRQPIASNGTAEGRKRNQRVEIKVLELQNK